MCGHKYFYLKRDDNAIASDKLVVSYKIPNLAFKASAVVNQRSVIVTIAFQQHDQPGSYHQPEEGTVDQNDYSANQCNEKFYHILADRLILRPNVRVRRHCQRVLF